MKKQDCVNSHTKLDIVFVHSGRFYSDPILEYLLQNPNLNIIVCENTADVIKKLLDPITGINPALVIIEGRIPHGGAFTDDETEKDFCSGTILYFWIRDILRTVPIVIFTADPDEFRLLSDCSDDAYLKIYRAGIDLVNQVHNCSKLIFKQPLILPIPSAPERYCLADHLTIP